MSDVAESDFLVMDAEWRRITCQTPAGAAPTSVWEADMVRLSEEHDSLMRSGRWVIGAADMLSIIGRTRYESHHSAMLAWLLDPRGKHSLGTTLLASLLRLCGRSEVSDLHLHRARAEVEVPRSDTRADIVVSAPGVTLIIENKVDAGEQERQCERLYEHFGADPGAVFVFLTPTGRAPRTATGPAREAWTTLSYKDLARLVEAALRSPTTSVNASGRSTAENYLMTLQREFV
jgi:hypothetical protein